MRGVILSADDSREWVDSARHVLGPVGDPMGDRALCASLSDALEDAGVAVAGATLCRRMESVRAAAVAVVTAGRSPECEDRVGQTPAENAHPRVPELLDTACPRPIPGGVREAKGNGTNQKPEETA